MSLRTPLSAGPLRALVRAAAVTVLAVLSGCGSPPVRPSRSPLAAHQAGASRSGAAVPAQVLHRTLVLGDAALHASELPTELCALLRGSQVAQQFDCEGIYGETTSLFDHSRSLDRPDSDLSRLLTAPGVHWDLVVLGEHVDPAAVPEQASADTVNAVKRLSSAAAAAGARTVLLEPVPGWQDFGLPAGPNDYQDRVRTSRAWARAVAAAVPELVVVPVAQSLELALGTSMDEGLDPFEANGLFAHLSSPAGVPSPVLGYITARMTAQLMYPTEGASLSWVDNRIGFSDVVKVNNIIRTATP